MPTPTPNVFTFPRNEPGTSGHFDLVEALRDLPRSLAEALAGITDAQAACRPSPGAWCIKEIAGHLRDAAEVYHKRLYMMSTQTDPILEPYDPDAYAYARDHGYLDRNIGDMIDELRRWRGDTVQLLTTLVNWNWARTGQHLEAGRMSIRQLVEHMIDHEAQHLASIRTLRTAAP